MLFQECFGVGYDEGDGLHLSDELVKGMERSVLERSEIKWIRMKKMGQN
jgi:hypothetical protein